MALISVQLPKCDAVIGCEKERAAAALGRRPVSVAPGCDQWVRAVPPNDHPRTAPQAQAVNGRRQGQDQRAGYGLGIDELVR